MKDKRHNKIKLIVTGVILFGLISTTLAWINSTTSTLDKKILGTEDSIEITARVYGCTLELTVKPEERDIVGDYTTTLQIEILDTSLNPVSPEFTVTTNSSGFGTENVCNLGIYNLPDQYYFRIAGYSHLWKLFTPTTNSFESHTTTHDFTTGGRKLIAGETSNTRDNIINTIDISTQIQHIFETTNIKNDLDYNGVVDTLDISITIKNLFTEGD